MTERSSASLHLTQAELLAHLDGELPAHRRTAVEAHLSLCSECDARLASLRSAAEHLSEGLRWIDRPAPDVAPGEVLDRAGSRGKRHLTRRALLKAAVLLLMLGGASAAAIPGSPVRDWLAGSIERIGRALPGDDQAASRSTAPPATGGVAVAPADGEVRVSLLTPSPDAMVRVSVVADAEASVSAAGARYRTGPGWIEVIDAGPGEIRIELPRSAAFARVEIDGRVIVRKEGRSLRLLTSEGEGGPQEVAFPISE